MMALLEQFKRTNLPAALVVDEFGEVAGMVSLTDVISAIVGDLPTKSDQEPMIVKRDDGSWLLTAQSIWPSWLYAGDDSIPTEADELAATTHSAGWRCLIETRPAHRRCVRAAPTGSKWWIWTATASIACW